MAVDEGASGALATGAGSGVFWQAVMSKALDARLKVRNDNFPVVLVTTVFILLQTKDRF
jgi:hypothetical protein